MEFHCGKSAEYHRGPVILPATWRNSEIYTEGNLSWNMSQLAISFHAYSKAILDIVQLSHWSISPTTALHIAISSNAGLLPHYLQQPRGHPLYVISTFVKLYV